MVPEDPDLLRDLHRNGDLVPVEQVSHPHAAPPEVWAQLFVSHLTATIADQLGRMNMSDWFTFDEITLHSPNRVVRRYAWHLVAGDEAYVRVRHRPGGSVGAEAATVRRPSGERRSLEDLDNAVRSARVEGSSGHRRSDLDQIRRIGVMPTSELAFRDQCYRDRHIRILCTPLLTSV